MKIKSARAQSSRTSLTRPSRFQRLNGAAVPLHSQAEAANDTHPSRHGERARVRCWECLVDQRGQRGARHKRKRIDSGSELPPHRRRRRRMALRQDGEEPRQTTRGEGPSSGRTATAAAAREDHGFAGTFTGPCDRCDVSAAAVRAARASNRSHGERCAAAATRARARYCAGTAAAAARACARCCADSAAAASTSRCTWTTDTVYKRHSRRRDASAAASRCTWTTDTVSKRHSRRWDASNRSHGERCAAAATRARARYCAGTAAAAARACARCCADSAAASSRCTWTTDTVYKRHSRRWNASSRYTWTTETVYKRHSRRWNASASTSRCTWTTDTVSKRHSRRRDASAPAASSRIRG